MGRRTGVPYAHHTFNPWWGCDKRARAGCANCFAADFANRFHPGHWGPGSRRRFFGEKHWHQPIAWNKAAEKAGERRRVLCGTMLDLFERLPLDHPDRPQMREERTRLQLLVLDTPWLDWLVLTKRPENIETWWQGDDEGRALNRKDGKPYQPNLWLGITAENRTELERGVPLLKRHAAAVHFVSLEPLLEPIRSSMFIAVDWVIVGAESGPKARPMEDDWVRDIRDQVGQCGKPFYYKQQLDDVGNKVETPCLDGRQWTQFPKPGENQ